MATHILARTRAVLDVIFSAGVSSTPVEVTVTDDAGDTVVDAGTATADASTPPIPGRYTFALPPQIELGVLRVDWTGTFDAAEQTITTWVEVVGGRLFTVDELRAHDKGVADEDVFPDWKIAVARDRCEDFFRDSTGVSFTRRRRRVTVRGTGSDVLAIPDKRVLKVVAASVNGQAVEQSVLDSIVVASYGALRLSGGSWGSSGLTGTSSSVTVTYEYGYDDPPAAIRHAAMILARREVVTVDADDRAVSLSNDLGTVRLSVPGPGEFYRTGIPVVDRALSDYAGEDVFV